VAESALRAGQYRINRLFDEVRIQVIGPDELSGAGLSSAIFRNLNTPQDVEAQQHGA
jgi:molybdopterin-guanine dinucleotide biosynthesis protein A